MSVLARYLRFCCLPLETIAGLHSCPSTAIKKLATFAERRRLLTDEVLFEAGDGVDELIFVLSGQLQITKPRNDGIITQVAVVGAVRAHHSFASANGSPAPGSHRLLINVVVR